MRTSSGERTFLLVPESAAARLKRASRCRARASTARSRLLGVARRARASGPRRSPGIRWDRHQRARAKRQEGPAAVRVRVGVREGTVQRALHLPDGASRARDPRDLFDQHPALVRRERVSRVEQGEDVGALRGRRRSGAQTPGHALRGLRADGLATRRVQLRRDATAHRRKQPVVRDVEREERVIRELSERALDVGGGLPDRHQGRDVSP